MAFGGYIRNRQALLDVGVDLYEFRPDAEIRRETMTSQVVRETGEYPTFGLHAKTMVVDDEILIRNNLRSGPRSANLNTPSVLSKCRSAEMASKASRMLRS